MFYFPYVTHIIVIGPAGGEYPELTSQKRRRAPLAFELRLRKKRSIKREPNPNFQLRVRKSNPNFQLRVRKANPNFQLRVRKMNPNITNKNTS